MELRPGTTGVLDVCPRCYRVWADWLDGDLYRVKGQLSELPADGALEGGDAPLRCPDCRRELYADKLGAALVHRCGACAGSFVPRASLELLGAERPEENTGPDEPWLTRVMDALARAISGAPIKIVRSAPRR